MAKRHRTPTTTPTTTTTAPLAQLLNVLVYQYGGTRARFAWKAKITASQLSHWMKPGSRVLGPGIGACVRIAYAGHCRVERVLHAAGHHRYAAMIEEMNERPTDAVGAAIAHQFVTAHELAHVLAWRELTPADQKMCSTFMKHATLARAARTPATDKHARKRA